ncbi:MAG TPA: M12 family metallo-peptidase [Saprospiraceae bacterium]|nr:M12 family metallo-peptidase [Saprospiraceae bacterium]
MRNFFFPENVNIFSITLRLNIIFFKLVICGGLLQGQDTWPERNLIHFATQSESEKLRSVTYELGRQSLEGIFRNVPRYREAVIIGKTEISLMDAHGKEVHLSLEEAPVAEDFLYEQYPSNRTFKVSGNGFSGRLAWSEEGLTGLVYTPEGHFFVQPIDELYHQSYMIENEVLKSFICETEDTGSGLDRRDAGTYRSILTHGDILRTFRIAILCTNEFCEKRNNNLNNINADIFSYLSVLNAMYERELAISFILVANNNLIVFNESDDGINPGAPSGNRLTAVHNAITQNIGSAHFDIGHAFHELDAPGDGGIVGSGVASIGTICNASQKGRGWSSAGGDYDAAFFMYIFGHEVGHQLNARHTFYGTSGSCAGTNRSPGNGYEPGSGNTLMSYEGICLQSGSCTHSHNIEPFVSTFYLHAHSIQQILNYVVNEVNCYQSASTGNSPPSITVPGGFIIPAHTAFQLEGSATDPDGDLIRYNWEQFDTDMLVLNCPDGEPLFAGSQNTGPVFRSYDPSPQGFSRMFPALQVVLTGNEYAGEVFPLVGRTMNFRLNARDFNPAGGGYSYSSVPVTVDGNSGPFRITMGNLPLGLMSGQTLIVTWDVAGTNAPPVSCNDVDIYFSTDGGLTFPYLLASQVPNEGSAEVTLPIAETSQGRIMIKAFGNIFLDINKSNITLISDCSVAGGTIIFNDPVVAALGDEELVLNLRTGLKMNQYSATINESDLSTGLIFENGENSGQCGSINAIQPKYHQIKFIPDADGDYTILRSADFFPVINVYSGDFNPVSLCQNWIASGNYLESGFLFIRSPFTVNLSQGQEYTLVISDFDGNDIPGTYTLEFIHPNEGNLFNTHPFPGPGMVITYITSDENQNILDISDEVDLSNSSLYPPGKYEVISLSYLSSQNPAVYIGQSISDLQNSINSLEFCGALSENWVEVTIQGCIPGIQIVTNTSSEFVPGSLSFIVEQACPGDTIYFDTGLSGETIVVQSEIVLDKDLNINGLGMNHLTLSGDNSHRIFNIQSHVVVSLKNVSLKNGASAIHGGALRNMGELILENVLFENNLEGSLPKAFTNHEIVRMFGQIIIQE